MGESEFAVLSLCGKRKPEGVEEAVEKEGGGGGRGVPAPSKGGRDRHLPRTLLAPAVKATERPRSKSKLQAAAQRELVGLWLEGTADWTQQRYIYPRPVSFRGDPQDIGISHTQEEGLL